MKSRPILKRNLKFEYYCGYFYSTLNLWRFQGEKCFWFNSRKWVYSNRDKNGQAISIVSNWKSISKEEAKKNFPLAFK